MILITGCARSGTSLTAGFFRACGANLGPTNILNEHTGIRDKIVKPYLRSIGADPLCQDPLPALEDLTPHPDLRKLVDAMFNAPEPRAYKGAKMCLMWPLWAEAYPEAKWVIVRRERHKIVESCLRTTFMRNITTEEGWDRWARIHEQRFEEMKQHLDCIDVFPDEALRGEFKSYRAAMEFTGLRWNEKAVIATIQPERWHAA